MRWNMQNRLGRLWATGAMLALALWGCADKQTTLPDAAAGDGGSGPDRGRAESGTAARDRGADLAPALPTLGVYAVEVDGSDLRLMLDSGARQITHVRRLADSDWYTATRYNDDHDGDGYAREGETVNGVQVAYYDKTEIIVFRGSAPNDQVVVAGGQEARICANSSWTGEAGLIFVQSEVAGDPASIRLKRAFFATLPEVAAIAVVPTPPELLVPVDPDQHGLSDASGMIVFSARFKHPAGWMAPVWRMPATGTSSLGDVAVVGCPLCPEQGGCCGFASIDELRVTNDARINHAGTEVAWMQQHPAISFGNPPLYPYLPRKRVLANEAQLDLAPADRPLTTTMSYPEWRGDDVELVHWAIELEEGHVRENLYRMKPDGSGRQRIPLPPGLCGAHPSYLSETRIVFSGFHCD